MTSNEINGLASHLWKHVYTEAQKQPYLEKEKALKEQYKIESAAYQANKKEEAMEVDDELQQKEVRSFVRSLSVYSTVCVLRCHGVFFWLTFLFPVYYRQTTRNWKKVPAARKTQMHRNGPKRPICASIRMPKSVTC